MSTPLTVQRLIRYLDAYPDLPLPPGAVDVAFIRAGLGTHLWESIRVTLRDLSTAHQDPATFDRWNPPRQRRCEAMRAEAQRFLTNIEEGYFGAVADAVMYVFPYLRKGGASPPHVLPLVSVTSFLLRLEDLPRKQPPPAWRKPTLHDECMEWFRERYPPQTPLGASGKPVGELPETPWRTASC